MHLQADVFASAECAAHTTQDQAYRFVGKPQACSDLVTVFMQPLRGHPEFNARAARVGHGECCFEAEEGLILHADLIVALHHHIAHHGGVAAHDALVTEHVAIGVNGWHGGVE